MQDNLLDKSSLSLHYVANSKILSVFLEEKNKQKIPNLHYF